MKARALAAVVAAVLALPGPASAGPLAAAGSRPGERYVDGEVLVRFRPAAAARKEAAVAAHGHAVLRTLAHPGWAHVRVRPGESVEEALAAYAADPDVEHAQPNFLYRIAAEPNDPLFPQLWGLRNTGQQVLGTYVQQGGALYGGAPGSNPGTPGADMDLVSAWDHVTDCSSVVVAVVDSGIHYDHQDLAANMWDGSASGVPLHGKDFVGDGDDDPMDVHGHGTHVAGIIGATGNDGVRSTGICWRASLMAVRVLDAGGTGTSASVVQGIGFAILHGARVINLSLGSSEFDLAFSDAIVAAQEADVVVVVAAGNNGENNDGAPVYPCSFGHPNLICVAALDQDYQLASFSNYGATSVDVGAPGTNILSTWAGTSALVTDPLTSGWLANALGYWDHGSDGVRNYLVNPPGYPSGTYASNANARIWKSFNIAGADGAAVELGVAVNVRAGDHLLFAHRSAGGDPFAGGTILASITDEATFPYLVPLSLDISRCASATCSFGFQLQSDATGSDRGVAIAPFRIRTLTANTTSYNTVAGTSMAAPAVAGLAAMVRTYTPGYDAVDVVEAIKAAGRPIPALAGRTTSGRAADAMATLAHIRPPSGVTAVVR